MKELKQIDETAILWNKTKDLKYKRKWYRLIKELHDKNTSNINTTIRWNLGKRAAKLQSTNGSTRVSDVCRRPQRNNIKIC